MSETTPNYWPPLPARACRCAQAQEETTREERLQHLGELALNWYRAQKAWEDAPRADLRGVGEAMRAADIAEERVRAACAVAMVHEAEA